MIIKNHLCCILLACFLLSPLPCIAKEKRGVQVVPVDRATSTQGDWGNYHALIIGINAYKEWTPLKTAVKDATVLKDLLIQRYGFSQQNVILRTDQTATEWQINTDIRRMASSMEELDNLLIYFAGHGQLDEITGDGYWIPVEGKINDSSTWISQDYIKRILSSERVKGKNIVVVADSCYSGTILRGGPSLLPIGEYQYHKKLLKAAAKKSRQVITSGGIEPVADGGQDGHSLFAYYFIKALKENTRKYIDLENLFHTRVWKHVTEIGDQRPNVGRLRTPMDDGGQFVLIDSNVRLKEPHMDKATPSNQAMYKNQTDQQFLALQKEKEQLKADRLRLEAEKKQLAEKLKQQKLAWASKNNKTLPPKAKFKLAVLPWDLETELGVGLSKQFYLSIVVKALNDAIDKDFIFTPLYSSYQLNSKYNARPIDQAILNQISKDKIWIKEKFFDSLKPNTQLITNIGRQLQVDAVLIYRIRITIEYDTLEAYLIDVKNNRIYSSTEETYEFKNNEGYDGVYDMTRRVFKDFKNKNFKKASIISYRKINANKLIN